MSHAKQFLTLKDLKGRPGLTRALFVRSRTAALQAARGGMAVTAAGNHGALNIWRDGHHRLHAEFYSRLVSQNHTILPTLRDLELWLRAWWPALTGKDEAAKS
jgi:hypothetical protein